MVLRTAHGEWEAHVQVDVHGRGPAIPRRVFGNFFEHIGFAIQGGLWAQILSNPVFEREHNLSDAQRRELERAGDNLTQFYLQERNPRALPPHWTPGIAATGFGVCVLDDASTGGLPLPWTPLGAPGQVLPSVGRIGGAVRLLGSGPQADALSDTIALDSGPAGIRQGAFLPVHRTLSYTGDLWLRLAAPPGTSGHERAHGVVEVGLRRRLGGPGSPASTRLVCERLPIAGEDWVKVPFALKLAAGSVHTGEPVDFYVRWLPSSTPTPDVLVDRVFLFPSDHVEGMDPDVIRLVREWQVPLLRWPGGNFVSHYHWRDGVGPPDLRPTRPNQAWGGLEYNLFGTAEFIRFCRLVGAEPHLVVNSGTGSPEEAAVWVEYCNGHPDTPMGRLRADQGHEAPYAVRLWEAGNEIFGAWQGGYHGADENARRYVAFARAMRAVDPTIELIATGNSFDFVERAPQLMDLANADGRWQRVLVQEAGAELETISLHSLPVNQQFLEHLTDEEAYYSLMAQPAAWERRYLPDLLDSLDRAAAKASPPGSGRGPIRLAITEWGVLGSNHHRPRTDNFGEVIYAGLFLNLMVRHAERIPIANATALLHGGCVRKAAEQVYYDPQYLVIQQYTALAGTQPLACSSRGPAYDVQEGPDVGGAVDDVPYVDAIACLVPPVLESGAELPEIVVAAVNQHLTREIPLTVQVAGARVAANQVRVSTLAYPDPAAVASLADPQRFSIRRATVPLAGEMVRWPLPPCSVNWLRFHVTMDGQEAHPDARLQPGTPR